MHPLAPRTAAAINVKDVLFMAVFLADKLLAEGLQIACPAGIQRKRIEYWIPAAGGMTE